MSSRLTKWPTESLCVAAGNGDGTAENVPHLSGLSNWKTGRTAGRHTES